MKLKGSEKRIVCMKSAGSRLFCEAFFVLREDAPPSGEQDMLREANRILEESTLSASSSAKKKSKRFWGWFLAGLLCGVLAVLPFALLLF